MVWVGGWRVEVGVWRGVRGKGRRWVGAHARGRGPICESAVAFVFGRARASHHISLTFFTHPPTHLNPHPPPPHLTPTPHTMEKDNKSIGQSAADTGNAAKEKIGAAVSCREAGFGERWVWATLPRHTPATHARPRATSPACPGAGKGGGWSARAAAARSVMRADFFHHRRLDTVSHSFHLPTHFPPPPTHPHRPIPPSRTCKTWRRRPSRRRPTRRRR